MKWFVLELLYPTLLLTLPPQRDRAWEIWPYPCIGQFRFLDLSIVNMPSFPQIVSRLKDGQKFLDVGCCFGQDLRGLVAAGAPGTSLHGAELHGQFHTMGYELFKDRETLGAILVEADLFEDGSLGDIEGTIDILQVCAFLHLFTWDKQVDAAKRLVKILSKKKGSMILGRMVGNAIPQLYEHGQMYLHNVESFEKFWTEVSEATDTKWTVRATVLPDERQTTPDPNSRWLEFEIERL